MITEKQAQALLALDYFGYANHGHVYGLHGEVIDELDTLGYVTVGITDAKKHYIITDTGRIALEEFAGTQMRFEPFSDEDMLIAELEAENAALRALLLAAGDALAPFAEAVEDADIEDSSIDEYIRIGRSIISIHDDSLRVKHLRAIAAVAAQIVALKGEG